MQKRQIGKMGEAAAEGYLIENKCTILAKNYFTKYGEIDIIFKEGNTVVFAEVKYRSGERFGKPAESVTNGKIKRISLSALQYLYENRLMDERSRFDVIEVTGQDMQIRQIKNAFEAQID